MEGIAKSFGHVGALTNVDFYANRGEIVGLVGDNGAGKSTLIKILMGIYPPDRGKIFIEGKETRIQSPHQARALGLEAVYQDLSLVNLMSITRNFFLGKELLTPYRLLDMKQMNEIATASLREVGITIRSPAELVGTLSGGERQAIAIARAMYFGAKLLVLDEPTAALSVKETARVAELVKNVAERGVSVVMVAHDIHRVYSIASRITILEKGVVLGDFKRDQVSVDEVIDIILSGKVRNHRAS
jgi:simple sugar transport system ATP-binding protein